MVYLTNEQKERKCFSGKEDNTMKKLISGIFLILMTSNLWAADLYVATRDGNSLEHINTVTDMVESIFLPETAYGIPFLTADGKRILVTVGNGTGRGVYEVDLTTHEVTKTMTLANGADPQGAVTKLWGSPIGISYDPSLRRYMVAYHGITMRTVGIFDEDMVYQRTIDVGDYGPRSTAITSDGRFFLEVNRYGVIR